VDYESLKSVGAYDGFRRFVVMDETTCNGDVCKVFSYVSFRMNPAVNAYLAGREQKGCSR